MRREGWREEFEVWKELIRDDPVVQGCALVMAGLFVFVLILVLDQGLG